MAHVHSVGSTRLCSARGPRLCRASLGLRGPRQCGAARERTPERSPLSGRASRRGRRWRYRGGGGAREGARAPTAERPPTGQVGGGGSSPELLADRKGGKTETAAAFSNEVGAPVAGGVLRRGGEGDEAQAHVYPKRKRQGGGVLGASLTVEGFTTAEAAGQQRWCARTEARCSNSDVVGFGHGRRRGRDGRARGEGGVGSAAVSSDTTGRNGF
jgi:hypothetical protein